MRSKASIKSHPIHPMLVPFPIAFYTGTFIFDLLALASRNESFADTALYLNIAGIIGAVAAAVPGVVDYFGTVPPDSSAKKRATKHGLLNTTVLVIFIIAYFIRRQDDFNYQIILAIEFIALGLTVMAGWMGGTLVYRNQIGVDPRYAYAGKWKEIYPEEKNSRIEVAFLDELKVDQMKLVHVQDKRIVVARSEEGYVAFNDHCSHRGGSLAGGMMICGTVQCPWHGSQFDVRTGAVKAGPADEKIVTYNVQEEGGKVYLLL